MTTIMTANNFSQEFVDQLNANFLAMDAALDAGGGGGVTFGDGTEALPALTFGGDVDTGIWHPAANQIGISIGGTQALLISGAEQYPSASFNFSRDLGALQGGGASTVGTLQELAFSGATDANGSIFGTRRLLNPSGSFGFPIMMVDYKGIINDAAAGTNGLAYTTHNYIWLNGGQAITNARVFYGHFRNDGTANISAGIVFFAGDSYLSTGTGLISTIIGFATSGELGHATRVGTAIGFQMSNTVASGSVKGYYSKLIADANKIWSFVSDDTAPSYLAGNLRLGSGDMGTAPQATLELRGNLQTRQSASGTTAYAIECRNTGTLAADSAVVISLDPQTNGPNVRDAQIRATTDGASGITMAFYTANAATPVKRWSILHTGHFVPGVDITYDVGASATRILRLWARNLDYTGTMLVTQGTLTGNSPIMEATTTWNNGAIGFSGIIMSVTNTASAASARLLNLRVGGATVFDVDVNGSTTTTGKATTAASTTTRAGLNLPHGTAPSSPVNGDVWTTTAGLYVRVNGSTVGPLS